MRAELPAWKHRSLFRQLLLVNCAIIMASIVALSFLIMVGTLTMQKKRFAVENRVRLEDFAGAIADEAVIGDDASIENYLRGRVSARDVFQVRWIDRNGKIIQARVEPEKCVAPAWLANLTGLASQENVKKLSFGGSITVS